MLIDTHCHIHDSEFYLENREEAYKESVDADVTMICVGTDERSSREVVDFVATHDRTYGIVGVHPHEAKHGWSDIERILSEDHEKIIGIGEIGLDYFYSHSTKEIQIEALEAQLQLALTYDLPVSFHVREAFDDFWPIFDQYPGIRGVLHSFTDTQQNLDKALERGLYIGINGISTFTKDELQKEVYKNVPIEHILLETDAPFLTPAPLRGKMNLPAYVGRVAEHQAMLKSVLPDEIIRRTTQNAKVLFRI